MIPPRITLQNTWATSPHGGRYQLYDIPVCEHQYAEPEACVQQAGWLVGMKTCPHGCFDKEK